MTKITIKNYNSEKGKVDWAKLPKVLSEGKDTVESMLDLYDDDTDIKDAIDTFFEKLNAHLAKAEKPAPKKVSAPKKAAPKKKPITKTAFYKAMKAKEEFKGLTLDSVTSYSNVMYKELIANLENIAKDMGAPNPKQYAMDFIHKALPKGKRKETEKKAAHPAPKKEAPKKTENLSIPKGLKLVRNKPLEMELEPNDMKFYGLIRNTFGGKRYYDKELKYRDSFGSVNFDEKGVQFTDATIVFYIKNKYKKTTQGVYCVSDTCIDKHGRGKADFQYVKYEEVIPSSSIKNKVNIYFLKIAANWAIKNDIYLMIDKVYYDPKKILKTIQAIEKIGLGNQVFIESKIIEKDYQMLVLSSEKESLGVENDFFILVMAKIISSIEKDVLVVDSDKEIFKIGNKSISFKELAIHFKIEIDNKISKPSPKVKDKIKTAPKKTEKTHKGAVEIVMYKWTKKTPLSQLKPIDIKCQHYAKKAEKDMVVGLKGEGNTTMAMQVKKGEYLIFDGGGHLVYIMNAESFKQKCTYIDTKKYEAKPTASKVEKPNTKKTAKVANPKSSPKPKKRSVCTIKEAEDGSRLAKAVKFFLNEAEDWNNSKTSRKITKVMRTRSGEKHNIILEVADYGGFATGLATLIGRSRKYYRLCIDSHKLTPVDKPKAGSYKLVVSEKEMKQVYTTRGDKQYAICVKTYKKLVACSLRGTCTTEQQGQWKTLYRQCGDLELKMDKVPETLQNFHKEVKKRRKKGEKYAAAMERVADEIKAEAATN